MRFLILVPMFLLSISTGFSLAPKTSIPEVVVNNAASYEGKYISVFLVNSQKLVGDPQVKKVLGILSSKGQKVGGNTVAFAETELEIATLSVTQIIVVIHETELHALSKSPDDFGELIFFEAPDYAKNLVDEGREPKATEATIKSLKKEIVDFDATASKITINL